MSRSPNLRLASVVVLFVLLGVPAVIGVYKLFFLGYRIADVLPRTEYRVRASLTLDGHLSRARVRTFLPVNDEHQQVSKEGHDANPVFRFSTELGQAGNREAIWLGSAVPELAKIDYEFSVLANAMHYRIDPGLAVPEGYPKAVRPYLAPEEAIQVDSPEILAVARDIGANTGGVRARLQKIFDFTAALTPRSFKGTTDALTALRLGEASCNGKSRLFVAISRAVGIPARLVGGLIMAPGTKRTSHQWVEAYVGGHWVPFGPTNGHFGTLPENYLVLYRGDESLFKHTSDINFDYAFTTSTRMVPSEQARAGFKAFNVWDLFARLNLPFSLLRTVLMLPIGALVVVLFRNVIGVPTFGTFLPALIAAAAGETGLLWGLISLVIVTLAVVVARALVQRLQLLHSPTLGILLTVVVLTMLGTSLAAEHLDMKQLARISYFPIAVMAIASERFYLSLTEQGFRVAAQHFAGTLLVVFGCYVVMASLAIQILVSGFPEVLLLVIAANIYVGRWVGVRLLEFWRFRSVLNGMEPAQ